MCYLNVSGILRVSEMCGCLLCCVVVWMKMKPFMLGLLLMGIAWRYILGGVVFVIAD